MLAQALPAWRRLLDAASGRDLLLEDGHFVVWETERSAAEGRAHWRAADIGTAHIRDASDVELAMLARLTTSSIAGAIRFTGSGQISDLGTLADRLEVHFAALGGRRLIGHAAQIKADAQGASVLMDDRTTVRADVVVIAAGAASDALLKPLGIKAPIIAERGYHIQSEESDWPMGTPPVVFEDRSTIVTRFASGLRAASFVEFARLDTPPDPRKWRRLHAIVKALGLSFPGPVHQWIGARPTLPDYLPAIGRSARSPAICYAFGHQHLGLTLAATTGEAVAAMLCGDSCSFDLAPFDLRRFGSA
jgi:D-amino-acid dehydrogenase